MPPVLFSVSYAGFWGQHRLDLPAFFRKAAALGYPAVEVAGKRPHLSPLDNPTDESVAPLREAARAAGVRVVTVAGYTDFTAGRHAAEVPFLEMQLAYVAGLCRLARSLGAEVVRVFSGYSPDPDQHQADWDRCVAALRDAAALAADHGVTLGLQNHHDLGAGTDAYVELLDDI